MIGHGPSHGRFAAAVLEGDRIRLVVVPALGARVVSLVDRATGREWLVQGVPPADDDAAAAWGAPVAIFGGAVAYGWDECLPTVASCPDPLRPAGRPLRDHGDAWGRPASVTVEGDTLVSAWEGLRWAWRLRREARLAGPTLRLDYLLENRGPMALPFLYSMHPLLALPEGSRIEVAGMSSVRVAAAPGYLLTGLPCRARWPQAAGTDARTIAWDTVRVATARRAAKLHGGPDGAAGDRLPGNAAVTAPDGSRLELAWDATVLPALGIWLDDGGWPPGGGRVQHALEPATSADDDLASALGRGRALWLEPGGRIAWSATWRVRAPGERGA